MPPKNISTGDDDDFIFPAGYQPFVPGYCCELRYDSRVPFLDNVYCVSGGSDGRSFAALQALSSDHTFDHTSYASGVKVKMPRLRPLFDEAQANDGIVDVIFRVGGRSFPAHQFVVLSRASGLQKFINLRTRLQQPMEVCLDDVPGLTAIMFETVLGQVYDGNRSLDEGELTTHQQVFQTCLIVYFIIQNGKRWRTVRALPKNEHKWTRISGNFALIAD